MSKVSSKPTVSTCERRSKKKGVVLYHHYLCKNYCPSRNSAQIVCNPYFYKAGELGELVVRGIHEFTCQPHLSQLAYDNYRKTSPIDCSQEEIDQMKETKQNLEAEEKAIAKAHVESILAGGSTDVYEALLREAKAKRTILEERLRVLEALNSNQMASQTEDEAEAIQGLVASVDEDLTVPELSDKEKHGLLTRIISSVQPQDEGVKITLRNAVGRTVENVVLSCGRYNSFGHPHSATLSRLAEQRDATFRTDIDGAIEIVSDGRACWVQTFR